MNSSHDMHMHGMPTPTSPSTALAIDHTPTTGMDHSGMNGMDGMDDSSMQVNLYFRHFFT